MAAFGNAEVRRWEQEALDRGNMGWPVLRGGSAGFRGFAGIIFSPATSLPEELESRK